MEAVSGTIDFSDGKIYTKDVDKVKTILKHGREKTIQSSF